MKLFSVTNKNRRSRLIAADNEYRAKEIAVICQCARKIENVTAKDITAKYIKDHGSRGFDISKISEGLFFQRINGQTSIWDSAMF